MLVLGAGVGLGVLLIWRAFAPRPTPIPAILSDLGKPGVPIGAEVPTGDPVIDRVGSVSRRIVEALGHDSTGLRREFQLVGRTPERHAFDKLLGGVAGLLVPNMAAAGLILAGMALPVGVVGVLSLVTCVTGFVLPDFLLRDEAERRRRAFRHTLSSYLDLVNCSSPGERASRPRCTRLRMPVTAGATRPSVANCAVRASPASPRGTPLPVWPNVSVSVSSQNWPRASRSPDPTVHGSAPHSPPRPTPSEATRSPRPNRLPKQPRNG